MVGFERGDKFIVEIYRKNDGLPSSFGNPLEAVFGILHPLVAQTERKDQNVSLHALWHSGNMSGRRSRRPS